jgi:tRNA threonylcarbamoyladenosine biosynthesis protein TsaE
MKRHISDEKEMQQFGHEIGSRLRGGECLELVGDVGAGKTTFMKGLGAGLQVDDDVQSPSFTISRVYEARDNLKLEHYDFYRLSEAGIMSYEITESLNDPATIVAVEWAETVSDVLPEDRIVLTINYQPEGEGRDCVLSVPEKYAYIGDNS